MLDDIFHAFKVLRYPSAWGAVLGGVFFTIMIFAALAYGSWHAISLIDLTSNAWLNTIFEGIGSILILMLGWLCWPAFISAFVSLFSDSALEKIERDNYPFLPLARSTPLSNQIAYACNTLMRSLFYTVLVLPFYFIPALNLVVYLVLSGLLFGKEYYIAVAIRHMTLHDAESVYKKNKLSIFLTGMVIGAMFLIPIINIFAPILGVSFMAHRLYRKNSSPLRQTLALPP